MEELEQLKERNQQLELALTRSLVQLQYLIKRFNLNPNGFIVKIYNEGMTLIRDKNK